MMDDDHSPALSEDDATITRSEDSHPEVMVGFNYTSFFLFLFLLFILPYTQLGLALYNLAYSSQEMKTFKAL